MFHAGVAGGEQAGEHATDVADTAIQRQLAQQHGGGLAGGGHLPGGGKHRHGDGEVIAGAEFGQVGRGQPACDLLMSVLTGTPSHPHVRIVEHIPLICEKDWHACSVPG